MRQKAMITDRGSEHPGDGLLRDVTDDERDTYLRDGVVRLRQIIPAAWIDYLTGAVTQLMTNAHATSQTYTPPGEERFFSQAFPRFIDPAFEAWALHGPTKHLAMQIHPGIRMLRIFYDQVFAQEPGAGRGAPHHQDHPYLPIDGGQYFRSWVPLDTVSADGGALRYLKGSHRGPVYRPRSFSGNPDVAALYEISPYPEAPDFGQYGDDAWFIGDAEPGDALLHHPKTVHGSSANTSQRPRRAVTTIFVGDDTLWDPRPGTSFEHVGSIGAFHVPHMVRGEPVSGDSFPIVTR